MHRCLAVALSVCCLAASADPPRLEKSGHLVVHGAPKEFGGLSGLVISENGKHAQILNDRGTLFDVVLERDAELRLERLLVLRAKYLYIYDPKNHPDTEGLARGTDGGVFVSLERPMTILHYAPLRSWPDRRFPLPDLPIANTNRGLEALAVDPRGRLLTMPEAPPEGETGFPIYRLEDGAWSRIAVLDKQGPFLVVGADYGPDGQLYVLERTVSALGFRSRIRRVTLSGTAVESETLLLSHLGEYDNLEGISLWRDPDGRIRITLVSDNNFFRLQRTEFVEFILRE